MRALACGALLAGLAAGCGPTVDLGTTPIAFYDVRVFRKSDLVPGDHARFVIKIDAGTRVDFIQTWFGEMDDPTRAYASFSMDKGDYDATVPVPNPPPVDSKLWMIITSGVSTVTGAVAVW